MKATINPTGIRTVTVIVTHDDSTRDYSHTYTNRQMLADGTHITTELSNELHIREWCMRTFEDHPRGDSAWSLPRPKSERTNE